MLTLDPLPAGVRVLTTAESERLDTRDRRDVSPQKCITCGGTGTFRWYIDDRRDGVGDWKCNCRDQWFLYRYLLHCGIGIHYQRLGRRDATWVPDEAIQIVDAYYDERDFYLRTGRGLILRGPSGTGKTMIAVLLFKQLVTSGIEGFFSTYLDTLDMFRSTWRDAEERDLFYQRVRNTPLLVIDDVGRESQRQADTSIEMFEGVLRHRVASALPTIVTTNITTDKLKHKYGLPVWDLVAESCNIFTFENTSARERRAARDDNEAKLRLIRPIVVS